jgi:hydroxyacylglutathione hydrolase
MLKVKQFRNNIDNLGYLIYGHNHAIAIDGGAVKEILAFIENRKLELLFVTNTHGHSDHTIGNSSLLHETHARLLRYEEIVNMGAIELERQNITIYNTPGHTNDSVCFQFDVSLITGDTLFNGTVGNCFSGNLKNFYQSIKNIMNLSKDTIIYAGHDYVQDSMQYARAIEPDNNDIEAFLNNYSPNHVFSTLMEELKVNPYLRFNEKSIIDLLKKHGLPWITELQRWQSLMTME